LNTTHKYTDIIHTSFTYTKTHTHHTHHSHISHTNITHIYIHTHKYTHHTMLTFHPLQIYYCPSINPPTLFLSLSRSRSLSLSLSLPLSRSPLLPTLSR